MRLKGILMVGGAALALVVGLYAGHSWLKSSQKLSSVQQASEYHATSTGGNLIPAPKQLLVSGAGVLGSVVITGANTGSLNFYNATTTNVNFRTGQKPTSSIWIASIPASTAAGTYTFDAMVYDGLIAEEVGTVPTSTITWR